MNGCFVKLNFKAATDALWMNNDLCCYKTEDVFNILKASVRIGKLIKYLKKENIPV